MNGSMDQWGELNKSRGRAAGGGISKDPIRSGHCSPVIELAKPARKRGSPPSPREPRAGRGIGERDSSMSHVTKPFARRLEASSSPRPSPPPCGREGEVALDSLNFKT